MSVDMDKFRNSNGFPYLSEGVRFPCKPGRLPDIVSRVYEADGEIMVDLYGTILPYKDAQERYRKSINLRLKS